MNAVITAALQSSFELDWSRISAGLHAEKKYISPIKNHPLVLCGIYLSGGNQT